MPVTSSAAEQNTTASAEIHLQVKAEEVVCGIVSKQMSVLGSYSTGCNNMATKACRLASQCSGAATVAELQKHVSC